MGERLTSRTLRRLGHRRTDMSLPASALPETPAPDKPRVTEFGMTIAHIDDLGSRANAESDWTRINQLKDQRDSLLVGILRQGITGEVPPGASVRFKPSDSDPNHSIWVMVGAQDLKRAII